MEPAVVAHMHLRQDCVCVGKAPPPVVVLATAISGTRLPTPIVGHGLLTAMMRLGIALLKSKFIMLFLPAGDMDVVGNYPVCAVDCNNAADVMWLMFL